MSFDPRLQFPNTISSFFFCITCNQEQNDLLLKSAEISNWIVDKTTIYPVIYAESDLSSLYFISFFLLKKKINKNLFWFYHVNKFSKKNFLHQFSYFWRDIWAGWFLVQRIRYQTDWLFEREIFTYQREKYFFNVFLCWRMRLRTKRFWIVWRGKNLSND